MNASGRIALGMSGGVDSAVSAALLMRAGYEVVGVTCRFRDNAATERAAADAAAVCSQLGIRHETPECVGEFERCVVEPFVSSYAAGLTPSPCVGCNARCKMPALVRVADELGCDRIATGHYARIARLSDSGRFVVKRALDARKDQSYMLSLLSQEQLARLVLPLGAMTKAEVRVIAADLGLVVAEKAESQDNCFIEGDYRPFLRARGVARCDEKRKRTRAGGGRCGKLAGSFPIHNVSSFRRRRPPVCFALIKQQFLLFVKCLLNCRARYCRMRQIRYT